MNTVATLSLVKGEPHSSAVTITACKRVALAGMGGFLDQFALASEFLDQALGEANRGLVLIQVPSLGGGDLLTGGPLGSQLLGIGQQASHRMPLSDVPRVVMPHIEA